MGNCLWVLIFFEKSMYNWMHIAWPEAMFFFTLTILWARSGMIFFFLWSSTYIFGAGVFNQMFARGIFMLRIFYRSVAKTSWKIWTCTVYTKNWVWNNWIEKCKFEKTLQVFSKSHSFINRYPRKSSKHHLLHRENSPHNFHYHTFASPSL